MTNYLTDYAYFTNKLNLNQAVLRHVGEHGHSMSATEHAVLDIIHSHSIKFGAAQLEYRTIRHAIKKSLSTVRRAIRKLEKLGIIDRILYVHPVLNGLGANIYVIRPFEEPTM